MLGIFRCQIRVQQNSKPQGTNCQVFPFFGENFGFFQTDPYTLKSSSEDFFHTAKPILPKFQLPIYFTREVGPKRKKGKLKMKKCVRESVGS